MILRTNGPSVLPEGYKLSLYISQTDAERVRIFRSKSTKPTEASLSELQQKHFLVLLSWIWIIYSNVVLTLMSFSMNTFLNTSDYTQNNVSYKNSLL